MFDFLDILNTSIYGLFKSSPDVENSEKYSMTRKIYDKSISNLGLIFEISKNENWEVLLPFFMNSFINHTLVNFSTDLHTEISPILLFFESLSKQYVGSKYLFNDNKEILKLLSSTLLDTKVKPNSRPIILNIFSRAFSFGSTSEPILTECQVDDIYDVMIELMSRKNNLKLKDDGWQAFSKLIMASRNSNIQPGKAIALAKSLLICFQSQMNHLEHETLNLITESVAFLMSLWQGDEDQNKAADMYINLSSVFGKSSDLRVRSLASSSLKLLFPHLGIPSKVGDILDGLNAYNDENTEDPDYERRFDSLNALKKLNEQFSALCWLPIMNCLFFLLEDQDKATRANSADAIYHFLDLVADDEDLNLVLDKVVVPKILSGLKSKKEDTRKELVEILGKLIEKVPNFYKISDLKILLGTTEEDGFFGNIYHIQSHRRLRAMKRLRSWVEKGEIGKQNIVLFLFPILEPFIFSSDSTLAHEAIVTIGVLSCHISWERFYDFIMKYISFIKPENEKKKIAIKMVKELVNSLPRFLHAPPEDESNKLVNGEALHTKKDETKMDYISSREQIIIAEFFPPLERFVMLRIDDITELRLSVATIIVKMMKLTPAKEVSENLRRIMISVVGLLKTNVESLWTAAIKTIAGFADILEVGYIGYISRQLKYLLGKHAKRYLIARTVHDMLIKSKEKIKYGYLDYCSDLLDAIAVEDLFESERNKYTERSKDTEIAAAMAKEKKSKCSLQIIELLSSVYTFDKVMSLIRRLFASLHGLKSPSEAKRLEAALTRVKTGIGKNTGLSIKERFAICSGISTMIGDEETRIEESEKEVKDNQAIIQKQKPRSKNGKVLENIYIFQKLALEIVTVTFEKLQWEATAEIVDPLVELVGTGLLSDNTEVTISSINLLIHMVPVRTGEIVKSMPKFFDRTCQLLLEHENLESDLAKSSLQLLTVILNQEEDIESLKVKDSVIASVCKLVASEMEVSKVPHSCFLFLKAVLSKGIVAPGLYDIQDRLAILMVSDRSEKVRSAARGLYLQFCEDYPMDSNRWQNNISFLIKNLEYERDFGRQSVLEVIFQLMSRMDDSKVQAHMTGIFVGSVLLLVNDDNEKCRQMALIVLQLLFEKSNVKNRNSMKKMLNSWMAMEDNEELKEAAELVFANCSVDKIK